MKNLISCVAIIVTMGLMTACTNKDVATVGGAAVGGVVGSAVTGGSTAGTIVGAVGGGYVGRQLAH